jgi:adenylate cyclase
VGKKRAAKPWKKIAIAAAVLLILAGAAAAIWNFYLRPDVEPASLDKMAFPLPDKPSIAVLPFDNMSNDPDQEYFSDGMTDDIITDLSKISGLIIISRNSTFALKGKKINIPDIAKELGVRYVLEGSVRRAGDMIRINAQLIDAKNDHHLWAERFDGKNDNIFELQDKITGRIVSALAVKLSDPEQQTIAEKGTDNIFAYEAYLKGMKFMRQFTPEDYVKAIENFKKAIELDKNYSDAYANLAYTYLTALYGGENFLEKIGKDFPTCRLLARHYVESDMKKPTSRSYQVLARMELWKRHFSSAVDYAQHAVAISPNDADALETLGFVMVYVDNPEAAIKYYKKSIMLDPLHKSTGGIGFAYFSMGNYEQAVIHIEKALKDYPKTYGIRGALASAYAHIGNEANARKTFKDFHT